MKNLEKQAIGIVAQLFDLAEVPVDKRQQINDVAYDYVTEQLIITDVSKCNCDGINLKTMIDKGQKIKIKDNVVIELMKLGFEKGSAESMKVFENTEQIAHDIYEDEGTTYVTVEMCCEIPLQCCEALEEKEATS